MKKVAASEARRNWFRLLDEVAAGEVVVIVRNGRRIVLRRCEPGPARTRRIDYCRFLPARGVERADEWGWKWRSGKLRPSRALSR